MTSEVVELLRAGARRARCCAASAGRVPKFCTVVQMEAVEIGEHHAVLRATACRDTALPAAVRLHRGLLAQAPIPFDLPPAT